MKIASTDPAADNCKDQEKICGRIICNMKCVSSNKVLRSGNKSDQRKLSEQANSVNYKTLNPQVENSEDTKKNQKQKKPQSQPVKMVRKGILK